MLLAVALPFWLWQSPQILRRHGILIAIFASLFCFALSHKVYAGRTLLFEVPIKNMAGFLLGTLPLSKPMYASSNMLFELPVAIGKSLVATFRTSGRFFWPIAYALEAASIVGVLRGVPRTPAALLLAAGILLQWLDVQPLRANITATVGQPFPLALNASEWRPRVAGAKRVVLYPSFSCSGDETGRRISMAFQLLAAEANTPINSVYNARLDGDCEREHLEAETSPVDPAVLYVYLARTRDGLQVLPASTPDRQCVPFEWGVFCSARESGALDNG